jgi:hypothetical protein
MVTRSQARAYFDHVCNVVLRRDGDSLLKKALVQEGFETIPSFLTIDDDTISSLAFKDGSQQPVCINRGDMTLIRSFRNYVMTRMASGITVDDEWLTMTAEGFDAFRVRSLGTPFATPWGGRDHNTTTTSTQCPVVASDQRGSKRSSTTSIESGARVHNLVTTAMARHDAQTQAKRGKWKETSDDNNNATVSEVTSTGVKKTNGDSEREGDTATNADASTSHSHMAEGVHHTMTDSEQQLTRPSPVVDRTVRNVNVANITYTASAHRSLQPMSLVDRGANGGLAGDDVRVVGKIFRSVDIQGIDNHQVTDIRVGTVGGVVTTQKGPVVAIFHQNALLGKGPSIHSSAQLEHYKNNINDRSIHAGGLQRVKTLDGYVIPLDIKDGLPRLEL